MQVSKHTLQLLVIFGIARADEICTNLLIFPRSAIASQCPLSEWLPEYSRELSSQYCNFINTNRTVHIVNLSVA